MDFRPVTISEGTHIIQGPDRAGVTVMTMVIIRVSLIVPCHWYVGDQRVLDDRATGDWTTVVLEYIMNNIVL
jgi:hypothetical protein